LLEKKIIEKNASIVEDGQWGIEKASSLIPRNMYPLNTKPNIEAAISYFNKYAEDILPGYKKQLACNIVKNASRFDINVPDSVSIYASKKAGNKCYSNIMSRIQVVKTAQEKALAANIADRSKEWDAGKIVDIISDFDKIAGIEKYYGRQIKDPYITVFEKYAAIESDGSDIVKDLDLQSYANSEATYELKGHLPQEAIDKFLVDPVKTYKSMPDVQKEVIKKGIHGVIK